MNTCDCSIYRYNSQRKRRANSNNSKLIPIAYMTDEASSSSHSLPFEDSLELCNLLYMPTHIRLEGNVMLGCYSNKLLLAKLLESEECELTCCLTWIELERPLQMRLLIFVSTNILCISKCQFLQQNSNVQTAVFRFTKLHYNGISFIFNETESTSLQSNNPVFRLNENASHKLQTF